MRFFATVGLLLLFPVFFFGQILSVIPVHPNSNDSVVITYNAKLGNGALAGFTGKVYAHAGLITTKSVSGHDWKHVVGNWGTDDSRVLMRHVGDDLYRISFNIRKFFDVNPEKENILQLAFVFRNKDGSLAGKSIDNDDIYYDLNESDPGEYLSHQMSHGILTITTTTGHILVKPYSNEMVRTEFVATGSTPSSKSYSVILQPQNPVFSLNDKPDFLRLNGSKFDMIIFKYPVKIAYVTQQDTVLTEKTGFYLHGNEPEVNFNLKDKEQIYGAGSRAIPTNRRGYRLQNYNEAHYGYSWGTENLNISIPLLMSSNNYALFFDSPSPAIFDIGKTNKNLLDYRLEKGNLVYYFILGNSRDEILKNYTNLTGHQPLPPLWALGYIQSRFGYKTESEARDIVTAIRQDGFPLDALVLDLYWFGDPSVMGNLSWDYQRFPDPVDMMRDFKKKGVKTIIISEPYVTAKSSNFSYLNARGYFAKNSSGETYVLNNFWAGPAALLDFTKKGVLDWMWNYYKIRKTEGVSGWWCDLGEPEDHPDDMIHAGGDARSIHNIFSLLWEKSLFDHYKAEYSGERLFNLSRSGYAGMQRYSVFPWSGDIQKSWDGLRAQLPIMLGMGLCGVAYMGSDIGGFTGEQNDELYTRWMEFGAFSPVMRAHGVNVPPEPIFYPTYYRNIVKKYIKLRYQLLPYNYTLSWENTLTGRPLALPLNYFNPQNTSLQNIDNEYFWGKDILVAPIFEQGQTSRSVRFPDGLWVDFWGLQTYSGGRDYTVNAPLDKLPLFVRAGSFIPFASPLYSTDNYHVDTIFVWYYPDVSVPESTGILYSDDGKSSNSLGSGQYDLIHFIGKTYSDYLKVNLRKEGNGFPGDTTEKEIYFEMQRINRNPVQVLFNNSEMPIVSSPDDFKSNSAAAYYLASDKLLKIHFPWDLSDSKLEVQFGGVGVGNIVKSSALLRLGIPMPNPFSQQTRLSVDVPAAGKYSMQVVDIWGQQIYHKNYFFTESNTDHISWNGKDFNGNNLGNGIYLIIISDETGNHAYRKVVLKR
jgi:alpha-glucosidase (family GH31 glycosyl hydrolase)